MVVWWILRWTIKLKVEKNRHEIEKMPKNKKNREKIKNIFRWMEEHNVENT